MPIRKLAGVTAYSPEQLTCLIAAYDGACAALGVARTDAAEAEAVALKVLEFAGMGEFDPDRLRDYVVHAMRPGEPAADTASRRFDLLALISGAPSGEPTASSWPCPLQET